MEAHAKLTGKAVFGTDITFPDMLHGKILRSRLPDATPLAQETGQGANPAVFWMYAAQAVEVEVDTSTGEVEVLRCVSAHDVGRALNPLNCVQQVEGAVSQGIGYALMEELLVQDGKVRNPNFRDYKVPTALDHALAATTILVEAPHAGGLYGAKVWGNRPSPRPPRQSGMRSMMRSAYDSRICRSPQKSCARRSGERDETTSRD